LIGSDEGSRDAAEGEHNGWEATGEENEWGGDTAGVTSRSEHRSQQSSRQDQRGFVEGETSQKQAPWSVNRDSAQGVQNEARTPSEERGKAEAGHEQSLASSEHVGSSPPEEMENVEQNVTMSNTVQLPQHALATGSGGDSAAGENDFVVIADLTAPEEVVVIDLSEKTQEIGDTQENDRLAHTVRLPRAFPTAAGEAGDLDIKLNLAKAYIELGDPKGAREILDEVVHSGNDVQKQDAETLRRQLG
ncbi:MAG: FimV/HubP family polar landmark protein, partial [Gammaproteobacteria bacterium]